MVMGTLYLSQTRKKLLSVLWNKDVSHTVPQLFSLRLPFTPQTVTATIPWKRVLSHTADFPLLPLVSHHTRDVQWKVLVTQCFLQAGQDDKVTRVRLSKFDRFGSSSDCVTWEKYFSLSCCIPQSEQEWALLHQATGKTEFKCVQVLGTWLRKRVFSWILSL